MFERVHVFHCLQDNIKADTKEANLMWKERHFLGGCARGQDIISKGVARLKDEKVFVWWPGERCGPSHDMCTATVAKNPKEQGLRSHIGQPQPQQYQERHQALCMLPSCDAEKHNDARVQVLV